MSAQLAQKIKVIVEEHFRGQAFNASEVQKKLGEGSSEPHISAVRSALSSMVKSGLLKIVGTGRGRKYCRTDIAIVVDQIVRAEKKARRTNKPIVTASQKSQAPTQPTIQRIVEKRMMTEAEKEAARTEAEILIDQILSENLHG